MKNEVVTLTDLAARIRVEHEAVGKGLQHAVAAGVLLVEAKSRTAHGEWCAWLEVNCEMSERTARAYMRVARAHRNLGSVNRQRVADSSFRGALKLLSKAATPIGPEFVDEAEGTTVVQLRRTDPFVHRYTVNLTESEFQAAKENARQRNLKIGEVIREALRVLLGGEIRQAAE